MFRYAEARGVERDMAVYRALIQTLQSAGRWSLELNALRENGDDKFIPEAEFLSAEEAFRIARDIYAVGLEEGTLSSWCRDEEGHLVLDLHRLPVSVAVTAVSLAFERMAARVIPVSSLRIITGRGNHVNNSGTRGVLRSEVEAFITRGMSPLGILMTARVPGNEGCIDVPAAAIEQWISARAHGT